MVLEKHHGNPLENVAAILVLKQTYVPNHPLSNGKSLKSIAISVAKLFNKQPTAFCFEMDSSIL